MRPRCVALATRDPALYAELAPALRDRGIRTISLLPGERIPERAVAVLTSDAEAPTLHHPHVIGLAADADRTHLWAALEGLFRSADHEEVTVGIDPGPRPGFAALLGSALVAQGTLESPESVARLGQQLKRGFPGRTLRFRVGRGDRPARDRIVNALEALHPTIELVDERRTTPRGHRRPRDATAARLIATTPGQTVAGRVPLVITPGDIANVQRISREHSGGRLTISRSDADRVLRGEITLGEAVGARGGTAPAGSRARRDRSQRSPESS
ncbi:MAG TPA: hypothetical protein VFF67_06105 [Thermoplasmata archaeon]|nr:hypothetical protein [Thermoplasmata archaeon]